MKKKAYHSRAGKDCERGEGLVVKLIFYMKTYM